MTSKGPARRSRRLVAVVAIVAVLGASAGCGESGPDDSVVPEVKPSTGGPATTTAPVSSSYPEGSEVESKCVVLYEPTMGTEATARRVVRIDTGEQIAYGPPGEPIRPNDWRDKCQAG